MSYAGKKNQGLIKMTAATLAMALVFSCLLPQEAWAGRSRAGGGKVARVDAGDIVQTVAISVGTAIGTQVISGALGSASKAATSQQWTQSATRLSSEYQNLGNMAYDVGDFASADKYWGLTDQVNEISRIPDVAVKGSALHSATTEAIKISGDFKNTAAAGLMNTAKQIQSTGGIASSAGHALGTAGRVFTNPAHLGEGIKSVSSFSAVMPTAVSGFNTYVATSQTSRAAGMAGYYYDWKPSITYIVSSVATGGVTGLLNPEITLATDKINPYNAWSMTKGAAVGSLSGLGSSLGTVAVDRKRIDAGESPGTLALITGNITGLSATLFGRTLTDPDTYHKISGGFFEQKRSSELAAQDPRVREMQAKIQSIQGIDEALSYGASADSEVALRNTRQALVREVETMKKELPAYLDAKYGQEYAYRKIIGVGADGRRDYNVMPDRFFDEVYAGYKPVPTGVPDVFEMEKTVDKVGWGNLLGRYGKAAFIEPLSSQNWPILASQSLAIWAVTSLPEDKVYLSPLVQNMVFGMSNPAFRSLAAAYGIDSRLLLGRAGIGSKNDIMLARINYDYGVRAMAENERMAKVARELHDVSEQYRKGEIKFEDYKNALNNINTELNGPGARQLALINPDRMLGKSPEEKKAYIKEQLASVYFEGLSAQERKQQEEALSKVITEFFSKPVDRGSVIDMNFNLSQQVISKSLRFGMSGGSTDEALQAAGMGRNKLFLANVWRGAVSGALESSISGGVESAFDKNYPAGEGSIATQFFRPYAANMITAAIRGASWHYNWNEMSRQWDWYDKWESPRPQAYALRPGDRGYSRVDEELSRLSYEQSLLRHERALQAAGAVENMLPQSKWEVQNVVINAQGGIERVDWEEKVSKVPTFTLLFPRDAITGKPALAEAIARSIEQANMDYFATTFSFGRPMIRGNSPTEIFGTSPKNISAYSYMVHLNNLNNLANMGLGDLILYQARAANIGSTTQIGGTQTGAAAKNIMSSIVAIPGVAGWVNMQPERFVRAVSLSTDYASEDIDKELEAARNEFQSASKATQELKSQIEIYKSTAESKGMDLSRDIQFARLEAEKTTSTLRMEQARTRIYELQSQGLTVAEAPKLPSTVQQAAFAGPGAHVEFDAWVPFPNPAYAPEAQHGAPLNFLRNVRKESAPAAPEPSIVAEPAVTAAQKIETEIEKPKPMPEFTVDVKQEITEFQGAAAAANAGQIALTPQQALESDNLVSFRLDGDLSFRPGGIPPQVTPIYGPMAGPKDALPVPYLGPKEDPGIIGADGAHYFPNKDNETALSIKPLSSGEMEFSIVPAYQVPITPIPLVTAPGSSSSQKPSPQVIAPLAPPATMPTSEETAEISASVNGPVVKEQK